MLFARRQTGCPLSYDAEHESSRAAGDKRPCSTQAFETHPAAKVGVVGAARRRNGLEQGQVVVASILHSTQLPQMSQCSSRNPIQQGKTLPQDLQKANTALDALFLQLIFWPALFSVLPYSLHLRYPCSIIGRDRRHRPAQQGRSFAESCSHPLHARHETCRGGSEHRQRCRSACAHLVHIHRGRSVEGCELRGALRARGRPDVHILCAQGCGNASAAKVGRVHSGVGRCGEGAIGDGVAAALARAGAGQGGQLVHKHLQPCASILMLAALRGDHMYCSSSMPAGAGCAWKAPCLESAAILSTLTLCIVVYTLPPQDVYTMLERDGGHVACTDRAVLSN